MLAQPVQKAAGCRAPEIYATCVSMVGMPETDDDAESPRLIALRQMHLHPPRETASVLLARRRHPNYVPFVLANQSTGLITAIIMEDLLSDPEATVAFPQFGLTAAIVDPGAPQIGTSVRSDVANYVCVSVSVTLAMAAHV